MDILPSENIYIDALPGCLASHTPAHCNITTYDEYVGESVDPGIICADLVAISAITPGISRANEIGDKLRERRIACVIGGAPVSSLPEKVLKHFDSAKGDQLLRFFQPKP